MGVPGDVNGNGWADVIGTFPMYPEVLPKVLRLPAAIDAANHSSGISSAEMLAVLRQALRAA